MKLFAALKKPPLNLKHEIHKRLAGWEEPRPHFPLRASDLMSTKYEFCPREQAFMDLGLAQKKGQFVGTSLRMTFDHGSYMERQIRDVYLKDIVVGEWECGVCLQKYVLFGKCPTVKCAHCGYKRWQYREPRFSHDDSGVSGGIDFLIQTAHPKVRVIECKTMAPDEFKTLVAPLAEHKVRTSLYLKLIASSTWEPAKRINTQEATILYVMKSFGIKDESMKAAGIKDQAMSPFKEFTVKRDDSLLDKKLSQATVLKRWRDDKSQGMPCGICPNGFSKRAQGCSAVSPCWSGKYPHQVTWLEDGKPRHANKKLL